MRIKIKELKKAMVLLSKVTTANNKYISILDYVTLVQQEDKIRITTSDLYTWAFTDVEVETNSEFKPFAINRKQLEKIANEKVEFVDISREYIDLGKLKVKVDARDCDEFPNLPEFSSQYMEFEFNPEKLNKALKQLKNTSGRKDEIREALKTINVDIKLETKEVVFTTTCGRRLTSLKLPIEVKQNTFEKHLSESIGLSIAEMYKILELITKEEKLRVVITDGYALFKTSHGVVWSKYDPTKFPNYQVVLPVNSRKYTHVRFKTKETLENLKTLVRLAGVTADEAKYLAKIHLQKDKLEIAYAGSHDAESLLEIAYIEPALNFDYFENPDDPVGINIQYFIEALETQTSEETMFVLYSQTCPLYVIDEGIPGLTKVIMPIKIKKEEL